MDEVARLQAQYLQGLALEAQGQALQLQAFNQLVHLLSPRATGLFPVFSGPMVKPSALREVAHVGS